VKNEFIEEKRGKWERLLRTRHAAGPHLAPSKSVEEAQKLHLHKKGNLTLSKAARKNLQGVNRGSGATYTRNNNFQAIVSISKREERSHN
jgi:hypothetical protein